MRVPRRPPLILLALLAGACGPKKPPATVPTVFPLTAAWSVDLPAALDAPLASDGTRVFAALRDGTVMAVDAATGQLAWRRTSPAGTTVGAAPGGLVLRQADGLLVRLQPESGEPVWERQTGIAGSLAPVLDGTEVVVAGEGVALLSLESGRPAWGMSGTGRIVARPVLAPHHVLLVEEAGSLRARSRSNGAESWSFGKLGAPGAAPTVAGELVFLGTAGGRVVALDLAKGQPRWRWRVGADPRTPPAVSQRLALVASEDNVLWALGRGNGDMQWRAPLPSRPLSAPLLLPGGVLLACRETDVVGFDLASGQRIGAFATPGEMRVEPLLLGERLVVGLRGPWRLQGLALNMAGRAPKEAPRPGKVAKPRQKQGAVKGQPTLPAQPNP